MTSTIEAWVMRATEATRLSARVTAGKIRCLIASKNVDMGWIGQVAQDNNIDITNPMELNALLKAVVDKL